AQQSLHALDRIALNVKQIGDPSQQCDVVRPVVAPPATALQRLHLWELGLPEAQHVLRDVQVVGYLTDRAESVRRLLWPGAPCRRYGHLIDGIAHSSSSGPGAAPLTRAFNTWLGRNTSTRRGMIGTSSPVFGLRPTRRPF